MKKKTILLVDDNPDDVQLTLMALKKSNILNGLSLYENKCRRTLNLYCFSGLKDVNFMCARET